MVTSWSAEHVSHRAGRRTLGTQAATGAAIGVLPNADYLLKSGVIRCSSQS